VKQRSKDVVKQGEESRAVSSHTSMEEEFARLKSLAMKRAQYSARRDEAFSRNWRAGRATVPLPENTSERLWSKFESSQFVPSPAFFLSADSKRVCGNWLVGRKRLENMYGLFAQCFDARTKGIAGYLLNFSR
jgi:hypothetical protein